MVAVLNKRKNKIDSCSNSFARVLLYDEKAVIHKKNPFSIRLKIDEDQYKILKKEGRFGTDALAKPHSEALVPADMTNKIFKGNDMEQIIGEIQKEYSEFSIKDIQVLVDGKKFEEPSLERKSIFSGEVNPITLELGVALVPLVGTTCGGFTLNDKVSLMRKSLEREFGIFIPPVHVTDNVALLPYTRYVIRIRDTQVAYGDLKMNAFLAFPTPYVLRDIEGVPTKDPIYGEKAFWIREETVEEAKANGYTVLSPLDVMSSHLAEAVRCHLYELITRQDVRELLDTLSLTHPVLVEEFHQKNIDISLLQRVIQSLVKEGVSVRDLTSIVESLIDSNTDMPADCYSYVRERLAKFICDRIRNDEKSINVLILDEHLDRELKLSVRHGSYLVNLSPVRQHLFIQAILTIMGKEKDKKLTLLVNSPEKRCALAELFHMYSIDMNVLSTYELVPGIPLENIGFVGIEK